MIANALRSGKVTVCIPTHNRSQLLVRAIQGVLAQTYQDFEIVVSDDASSDNTVVRMREFDDPRIVFLSLNQNVGIARNTNHCLEHATGELLLVLNDDDELEPEALERLSEAFLHGKDVIRPEEVSVTWCPCLVQTPERQVKWTTDSGPPVELSVDLVTGMFDGIRGPRFCGIMVRTADALAVGGYDVRHGPIPDVGNWTQVALRRDFAVCVPEPLARYTAHNSSCTGTSSAKSWQQAGENIYSDLAAYLEHVGDRARLRRLKASHRNFISGLLATIIMQGMGRPGWVKLAVGEVMRAPQYFLTPMVARRLGKDGGKLLRNPQGHG